MAHLSIITMPTLRFREPQRLPLYSSHLFDQSSRLHRHAMSCNVCKWCTCACAHCHVRPSGCVCVCVCMSVGRLQSNKARMHIANFAEDLHIEYMAG
ncbi:unnamed protein product [Periconia digitata]|uniref:Uncharacterized protein n=1 Tax=Periconia digitata TaxID=1303443 RepID=A0A9W4XJB4_9PLEO|nr:unnamed protein product [Periconia digitata]